MPKRSGGPKPEMARTTVSLPVDLKRRAQVHALETGRDLQDLIAEGLRLVLAQASGKGGRR